MRGKISFYLFLCGVLCTACASAQETLDARIDGEIPSLLSTYKMLHASPELSRQEKETSAFVARELRSLGYDVTERVGQYARSEGTCYGLVGIMKNGEGPCVLIRTDLDALPLEEKTGLPYASKVRTENEAGEKVFVMHACGHDIHITSFLGTAKMLARLKDRWKGTLVLVGQPSEEIGAGAKAMLKDGLYTRFPRPDYAIALHDDPFLEAGKVGWCEGYALANVDSVDITILGIGGHGAAPSVTKDPIVIASEVVLALQTIVSREISPLDPAVVTVGSIHGGTKHNIIPDVVKLQLTVRTYREEVRRRVLAAIERITRGIALAAGVPEDRAPMVRILEEESTPSVFNDPPLTRRLKEAWTEALGKENVLKIDPRMVGEDFSRYSLEKHEIPISLFWLGAVSRARIEESRRTGKALPPLHSPWFTPDPEPTIRTGVKAMTCAALELLGK